MYGVADPSIFDKSRGESVADLMARSPNFIIWSPGDNARISGKMQYHNRLAFNSDGEAMFYCFNTCREFIRTIPALMYDEKNVEDIDTRWRITYMTNAGMFLWSILSPHR